MRTQQALLAVVFVAVWGFRSGLPARSTAVRLEKLRLDVDGKAQLDVVVTSGPPPEGGRVDVLFTWGGDHEIVTVVGLNAVNVRRIATATQPLACGASEQVTAAVAAPEDAKGPAVRATLRRQCQ